MGFEVSLRGKSLVYPSDTLNDPTAIQSLKEQGVVSAERARDLLEFPWHHHLILHEAGIPPIHTPVSYLASLDDWTKSKLFLVHVSARSLPADSGLRIAPTGLENTVDLKAPQLPVDAALELLDAMARVALLSELPVARAADFLRTVRKETYRAGERIVQKGTPGDRFYVILNGHAAIFRRGHEFKVYSDFDYFGETSLLTRQPRVADVMAKTDVTLLTLDRADFLHLLRGTDLPERLLKLAQLRKLPTWELLSASPIFRTLTANQKTQLQSVMSPVEFTAGQLLGSEPVVVSTGRVEATRGPTRLKDIVRGGFAGDARQVRSGSRPVCRFRCRTAVRGFRLKASALRAFFRKNPGVYLKLANLQTSAKE
jgi:hypothetical protein